MEKASERLGEQGIDINFKIPEPEPNQTLAFDMNNVLDNALEEDTITRTYSRVKDDLWSSFINIFSDSWGREEYEEEETIYRIDLEEAKNNMINQFDLFGEKVKEGHENYLNTTMKPKIEDRVQELENYLERYRGDLIQGVKDQESHAQYKSQFIDELNSFISRIQPLEEDTQDQTHCLKGTFPHQNNKKSQPYKSDNNTKIDKQQQQQQSTVSQSRYTSNQPNNNQNPPSSNAYLQYHKKRKKLHIVKNRAVFLEV